MTATFGAKRAAVERDAPAGGHREQVQNEQDAFRALAQGVAGEDLRIRKGSYYNTLSHTSLIQKLHIIR